MSETWQQVVMEKDPSTMKPADVAGLGAPPREINISLTKYVKQQKPSWAPLFIFLAFGQVVMAIAVIATGQKASTIVSGALWAIGMVAIAVWLAKRTRMRRDALRAVLRDGQLRFARILENRQVRVGRNVYKYFAVFDVDGRRVGYVSYNDGMSLIHIGELVEVVYNPQFPNEIVPTYLLV